MRRILLIFGERLKVQIDNLITNRNLSMILKIGTDKDDNENKLYPCKIPSKKNC